MFNDVDIDVQIEKENSEADEQLKTIRASTAMLRTHAEKLINCVEAEKNVTKALYAADSCDNAVTGICNAILAAQQNTVFKTKVEPEHLAKLQQLIADGITKEEKLLEEHQTKQAQMLAEHEEKMRKILSRGQGFWLSDFWAKVLNIAIFTLVTFLYVKFGGLMQSIFLRGSFFLDIFSALWHLFRDLSVLLHLYLIQYEIF